MLVGAVQKAWLTDQVFARKFGQRSALPDDGLRAAGSVVRSMHAKAQAIDSTAIDDHDGARPCVPERTGDPGRPEANDAADAHPDAKAK